MARLAECHARRRSLEVQRLQPRQNANTTFPHDLSGGDLYQAHELRLPDEIDLVCLPAYSPEPQPSERLWRLIDEPVVNRKPYPRRTQ